MNKLVETIEWSDENVRNFWDFYSQFPELYFTYQYGDRIVETVFPYMKESSKVLDYGCGTGFLIKSLVDKPLTIYGTDSSHASLESVTKKFGATKNFAGVFNVNELILDKRFENFFDAVCLIEVVEHLSDVHMDNVLSNIKTLLKKNGVLIITTPNEEDLNASLVYCPESKKVFHRWQHVRSWSEHSLKEYLSRHGIALVRTFSTDFSVVNKKPVTLKSLIRTLFEKTGLLKKSVPKGPHLVFIGSKQ